MNNIEIMKEIEERYKNIGHYLATSESYMNGWNDCLDALSDLLEVEREE
jgi:hypothetical protein